MKAQIITTDGRVIDTKPKNDTDFSLEELQEIVGGYIEIVRLTEKMIMVVNEEGKLLQLPVNAIASECWNICNQPLTDIIVGDVLLCDTDMVK